MMASLITFGDPLSLSVGLCALCQIQQKNLCGGQTPPPPSWQCRDFESFCYSHLSLRTYFPDDPPMPSRPKTGLELVFLKSCNLHMTVMQRPCKSDFNEEFKRGAFITQIYSFFDMIHINIFPVPT